MAHFSEAAKRNSAPILEALRRVLDDGDHVLEIASGTGQHAVHMAQNWPSLVWQPSDVDLGAFGLSEALADADLPNVRPPLVLDIAEWPELPTNYDAVYSANCLHTVPETLLEPYVSGAAQSLVPGGLMLLYGPFKYRGDFTTASNAEFDTFLRERYPGGGIRDFEVLDALARQAGLKLEADREMPSNNRFLVWRKPNA